MPSILSASEISPLELRILDQVLVSGYDARDLHDAVLSRLEQFTGSQIRERIDRFKDDLAQAERGHPVIFLSIGENCGPALRLQEVPAPSLGSGFFDFLVLQPGAFERLLREDFAHMLMLKNLRVSQWEGVESVHDDHYGVWYHHLFHLPQEKTRNNARAIDETDIPLLLSVARSQFEYLHEKLRLLLRSPVAKVLVYRAVEGEPLSERRVVELSQALSQYGTRNWRLAIVHSAGHPESGVADLHHLIPEHEGARWGMPSDWSSLVARLVEPHLVEPG